MKKFLFTMVVLLTMCSGNSSAQTDVNSLKKIKGIRLGISYNELQEGSLNRITHGGNGFSGGWFSEKSNGKTVKRFEFQFASNLLKSSFENEISSYHFNIPVGFHYLFNVFERTSSTGFYIGGFAEMGLNIEYFDNWDENHFYWLTSYSLGPDFRIYHCFQGEHKLQVDWNLPFVALVSRPPSSIMEIQSKTGLFEITKKIHENPRLVFIDRNFEIHFQAKYFWGDSKKVQPKLFWQIHYVNNHVPDSGRLKMINNSLGVEICF